jgi:hypothetical protein
MLDGLHQTLDEFRRRLLVLEVAAGAPPDGDADADALNVLGAHVSMLTDLLAPRGLHRCVDGVRTWPKSECYACGTPGRPEAGAVNE